MKKIAFFVFVMMLIASSSFADSRILENPDQPYDSLGFLELKVSKSHAFLKFLTLGIVREKAYQRMTRQLDKRLLKEACNKYGADAIAHRTYWPSIDSDEPVDFLYGRAEMIRFKKFALPQSALTVSGADSQPGAL